MKQSKIWFPLLFIPCLAAWPAAAQTVDELLDLVRRQSAEIEALKARLDRLEQQPEAIPSPIVWKGAPEISSADGAFSFKPRGRLQLDAWTIDDDKGSRSGSQVRRARLGVEGLLYRDFAYLVELEFGAQSVAFENMMLTYTGWSPVDVTAGYHKAPVTLDNLTDDNNVTFMERAAFATAFAPGRGVGLSATHAGTRGAVSIGIFGEPENRDRDGFVDEDWTVAGRATFAPVNGDQGLVHVGLSAYRTALGRNSPRLNIAQRPEFNLSPPLLETGLLTAGSARFIGLEAALARGPLHLQGEWGRQWIRGTDAGHLRFDGGYAQIGWFLTGDHRSYNVASGTFGRMTPGRPVTAGGPGAIELAARYSQLDLDDGLVRGGTLENWTLGLNWYLNPYLRLMLNWLHFDAGYSGHGDALGVRAQVDW